MKLKRLLRNFFKIIALFRSLVAELVSRRVMVILAEAAQSILAISRFLIPAILTLAFGLVVFDTGYHQFYSEQKVLYNVLRVMLLFLAVLVTVRYLLEFTISQPVKTRITNLLLVMLVYYTLHTLGEVRLSAPVRNSVFALNKITLYAGIAILFLAEASYILRFIYRRGANPALLFVGSFAGLILIGGLLLLLPNATVVQIHPVDAFFTSISAVCVTGLSVVDTATNFTIVGKTIILFLIQLGGFGIMTFAAMISYLVSGTVSFQNQLALRDMLSNNRLSNMITFVSRIVLVTISFELIGALFIYSTLDEAMFVNEWQKIFFSVFHSVSAFCNAGFSTLTNGLYEQPLRFNYSLQWTIAVLVILGGTGFPVVFNIFTFFRIKITNLVKPLLGYESREVFTNVLPASSKLALVTTAILLVVGFVGYFLFEFDATLEEHTSIWGKITTSFFGSVIPRSAGFNTVDIRGLALPTLMVYLFLMWIGASPGSTGGGIKTTVAAVAFLNIRSIIVGRKRTETHRTEISEASINRAFAIIMLSIVVLGIAVLLLSIKDSEKGLLRLVFEAFSAFSTVGLSLGVTPELSLFGKLVIMAVMFIGRVGALTLLLAFFTRHESSNYRYPKEEIMF